MPAFRADAFTGRLLELYTTFRASAWLFALRLDSRSFGSVLSDARAHVSAMSACSSPKNDKKR